MALHRNLTLLLATIVSFIVCLEPRCHAQEAMHYPPWMQPNPGLNDRNYNSNHGLGYVSSYDLRQIESARRVAMQYRSTSSPSSPVIAELATTNASLVEQWTELAESINILTGRVVDAHAKLQSATRDYEDVSYKLRQHGLNSTLGLLLSHKKSQLEDWQIDGSAGHRLNDEIKRFRSKQLENEAVKHDGSDITRQTNAILIASGVDSNRIDYAQLTALISSLLRERSDWLQMLTRGYNDHRQKLGELDSASIAFGKLLGDYRQLIDRHVTWIRSTDSIAIADIRKFRTGVSSMLEPRRAEDFGYSLKQKWNNNPGSGLMLLGSILVILVLRIVAKIWLVGIGRRKRMRETTSDARKCAASLLTIAIAISIPGLLYLVARWLGTGYVTESILHASVAIYAASFAAILVEAPRQLLRTNGFLEKHLKLELPRRQRAKAYLQLIGMGLVLSAYVVTLSGQIDHGIWSGSVTRLGLIALLLLVAWTAHLALKPNGGFLEPLVEQFGGQVLYRIRYLLYVLGVGFPLSMIALCALGYQFTATEIIKRAGLMFASIVLGAILWSAVKIVSSWAWHALTGTHQDRQDESYVARKPAGVSGVLAEHALELKHQIAFLGQCGLLFAALASIGWLWIDVFPNVRMGNPVVWSVQETVQQAVLDENGQAVNRAVVETKSITVLHLVLAGAALFVSFQLAKLLPGIFDVLVLQRVNFDEAMEHLSLVVGRFVLFGIGCFIACRLVGLRWETIQWPAVGLAIGLGFALQDVMRNLLGGLIVLFEKPARLGDLITVGNVTGRVASQKLRTTVLSDEEGREVIVPNKNFVSQDVIHWMGAGRLSVIPIEVSVTRDERPADICRKLQQLLVEQHDLLLSPAPQATLVCVSQTSQRIELRAWVEENQDATRVRDSLKKTVLHYLAEKNLLSPQQPRQPTLKELSDADVLGANRLKTKRTA
jgi:potassium efflux system protein